MFRKSKIKIVALIMLVLVVLFAGTLFVIYYTSYREVYHKNMDMLGVYAKLYWQNGNPEGKLEQPSLPDAAENMHDDSIYNLSTFYSVAFSDKGDVISVDNNTETRVTDEYLINLCRSLVDDDKNNGVRDTWFYYREHNQDITLIVLINNMAMSDNISTLFHNTLLFGGAAILLLLLPSIYFVHNIVKPLEENYQKQKQFISDASHELKTPIAVIGTNAEMLEREFGESKWLDNIRYETRQMGELVHLLLGLAHTENTIPQMTHLNFGRIVTGSVLPFESMAFEKEQILQLSVQEDVYVFGNEEQLINLVSILLDNALEYSSRQKTISVSLESEHHTAVLTVINEGEAIPDCQRKALFERFYRADAARSTNNGHYGLGLAIVKAIISAHNGKIAVTCKQNQVIFTATLPVSSQKVQK